MYQEIADSLHSDIAAKLICREAIPNLIQSYLLQRGYEQTLLCFEKTAGATLTCPTNAKVAQHQCAAIAVSQMSLYHASHKHWRDSLHTRTRVKAMIESGSTARAIQVLSTASSNASELWSGLSCLSRFRMHCQAAKELVDEKKVRRDPESRNRMHLAARKSEMILRVELMSAQDDESVEYAQTHIGPLISNPLCPSVDALICVRVE